MEKMPGRGEACPLIKERGSTELPMLDGGRQKKEIEVSTIYIIKEVIANMK